MGGTFSFVLYFIIMIQFSRSMDRMHKGIDDNQIHRSRANYLRDGENIIDTANTHFLPKFVIRPSGNRATKCGRSNVWNFLPLHNTSTLHKQIQQTLLDHLNSLGMNS